MIKSEKAGDEGLFSLLNQKLVLDVDFMSLSILGKTELTISPLSQQTKQFRINSRIENIYNVKVSGQDALWNFSDPLATLFSSDKSPFYHSELTEQFCKSSTRSNSGELIIDLPETVLITKMTGLDNVEPSVPLSTDVNNQASCFMPLIIEISFYLREPENGVYFIIPDAYSCPKRMPHMYTNNLANGARSWFPCVDNPHVKCTWDIEITIPRTVSNALGISCLIDSQRMIAISSGDLIEHLIHPTDISKKIFVFSCKTPVAASSIILAAGPFECLDIPGWGQSASMDSSVPDTDEIDRSEGRFSGGGRTFYLPGRKAQVESSFEFLHNAFDFLEQYMGSFPFSSYKQVFVEDAYSNSVTGATIGLFSSSILVDMDIVDQTYETRRLIVSALTSQWIDHYLGISSWADIWLSVGLRNFITSLFLQKHLGSNEYRYRLKMDIKRTCELDIGQAALYPISPDVNDPKLDPKTLQLHSFNPEANIYSSRFQLLSLKAPIVLYMLEKWMGKGLVQKTINKFIVSALSEELPNGISTPHFLRVARKICSKVEIKGFAEQWIYGAGCPRFSIKFFFNRKKMASEFKFIQECTNSSSGVLFRGPLTIRLVEPTGIYDTQVLIQDVQKKYVILYHTKYKRAIKTNKPKDRKGDEDMMETEDIMEMDDENDYGDNDNLDKDDYILNPENRIIYHYIRMDPETDWLCDLRFEQPDYMAVSQIRKDKDVVSQFDSISNLAKLYTTLSTNALITFFKDESNFYRLRADALISLSLHGARTNELVGLNILKKIYREMNCRQMNDSSHQYYPKRNDFSDLKNYFIQKTLISAIGKIRDSKRAIPIETRQIVLDALMYNDNTSNEFSDVFWVSTLITIISDSFLPEFDSALEESDSAAAKKALQKTDFEVFNFPGERAPVARSDSSLLTEAFQEIERYRSRDRLVSSYQNVVTSSSLQAYLKWMASGLMPIDISTFLSYTRYGTFFEVRRIALDCILLLDGMRNSDISMYMLNTLAYDPDPKIRYHLASSISKLIALKPLNQDTEKLRNPDDIWSYVDPKYFANQDFSKYIWSILCSPKTDLRIRLEILKICEKIYHLPSAISLQIAPKIKLKVAAPEIPLTEEEQKAVDALNEEKSKKLEEELQAAHADILLKSENMDMDIVKKEPEEVVDFRITNKTGYFILTKLMEHISAGPFINPVDETQAPNYSRIVKNPMEFSKILDQMEKGFYGGLLAQLFVDIRQIFKNCYMYNLEESSIYQHAKRLEHFFEKEVLPEAVPEMAAVMPSAPVEKPVPEVKCPVIPLIIPKLTKLVLPKKKDPPTLTKGFTFSDSQACRRILNKLFTCQEGMWFQKPVDPIALNIPTYFDIIKEPMDFAQITRKLNESHYTEVAQFTKDIRLVFSNAMTFNPVDSKVYKDAQYLSNIFENQWVKVRVEDHHHKGLKVGIVRSEPSVKSESKDSISKSNSVSSPKINIGRLIKKFKDYPDASIFLFPVNGDIYTTYYSIVSNPIDISTMEKKLENDEYVDEYVFYEDMSLMFNNCFLFNLPGTVGYGMGINAQKAFKKDWDTLKRKLRQQ